MLRLLLMAPSKRDARKAYAVLEVTLNRGDTVDRDKPLLTVHNPWVGRQAYDVIPFHDESISFAEAFTTISLMRKFPTFSRIAKEALPPWNMHHYAVTSEVDTRTETFIVPHDKPRDVHDILKFLPEMFPGSFFINPAPWSCVDTFAPLNTAQVQCFSIDEILTELLVQTVQKTITPEEMAITIVDLTSQLERAKEIITERDKKIRELQERLGNTPGASTAFGALTAWPSSFAAQSGSAASPTAPPGSATPRRSPPPYSA